MASNAFRYDADFQGPIEAEHRETTGAPVLLGESLAVRRLRSQVRRIAPYFRTALIQGETGVGKELVARCLHAGSPAMDGEFRVAEAATIAEAYRHVGDRCGMRMRERAPESRHGETLYLTGVGELPFEQQAALLRFLHGSGGRRGVGAEFLAPRQAGTEPRVRILAASEQDLRMLAAMGQFRQELYANLSAVEVYVPALRERLEDIPAIAEWLLRRLAEQTQQNPKRLTGAAIAQLQKARWPGNLRELERALGRAAALAEGDVIEPRHLLPVMEPRLAEPNTTPPTKAERLDDVIQQHVFDVLGRCGGNKLRAAELLGISRSTLYRMLGAAASARAG